MLPLQSYKKSKIKLITPGFLKEGDSIGIISTARRVSEKEINPCEYILESWGLRVIKGRHLFQADNQFSGTDAQRAKDLQNMLDDPNIKAILCARGGYGTIKIVDNLDFSNFIENPKWLIGYSDVTALHSHIHTNINVKSIHGIMAINFAKDNKGVEGLRKALFGEPIGYQIPPSKFNRGGSCQGVFVGGNLSLLYSMTGTNSNIQTDGKILFIEDVDEYLYHIDRMMMNLKRAGMLRNLAGLIVGGMTEMNDNNIHFGKNACEIIFEAVEGFNYPVCFDFPAGHVEANMPLIIGSEAKVMVENKKVQLQFIS